MRSYNGPRKLEHILFRRNHAISPPRHGEAMLRMDVGMGWGESQRLPFCNP